MKTDQTTTTTTVTTTTRRRKIPAPKPQRRLAKRVRTVTVRTAVVKLPKAMLRRIADAARTVKRAEVISVTTTRALPAPTKPVSALTVKERRKLPDPR